MRTDALDIARFYRTPQGRAARTMMLRRIKAVWPSVTGQDVLGFGYAVPVLEALKGVSETSLYGIKLTLAGKPESNVQT